MLGEGTVSNEYVGCIGSPRSGVCVVYFPTSDPKPWWMVLEDTLKIEKQKQEKQQPKEKNQKHEDEQKQQKPQKQDQSQLSQGPSTAAIRSSTPSIEEIQQSSTENISNPIATLEDRSGTPIIPSCSWFPSAIFLI
ncbi:hypothetical protein, unlikely [Trypanosoma congolense IL3000]|uniref:Uncharacterized protein n=1 Tax=Trypanosoma congolense (strain IL3000) TaxID=1068625 RepID=F9WG38_TRYCI|nr:hypothetical protein, unlikely [Trypanosoma congolense IL3000]